jgi:hypothetical protein
MMMNTDKSEGIDHFIYTTADLESGMDAMEQLFGTRPVPGGRHPRYGTHNALLSLGPSIYLEIMAPDPDSSLSSENTLFSEHFIRLPKLTTWVYRTADIYKLSAKLNKAGLSPGEVQPGSRETSEGKKVSWTLTDPSLLLFGGAFPFFIHWGSTPHPAQSAPHAGNLVDFYVEHPQADKLQEIRELIGLNVNVKKSDKITLHLIAETNGGIVKLS